MGRKRMRPPSRSPRDRRAELALLVGEVDQQHAVVDRDADQKDHTHLRLNVQRRARQEQHGQHADEPERDREHDDERPDPGAEQGDLQQVDQHRRHGQAEAQVPERFVHAARIRRLRRDVACPPGSSSPSASSSMSAATPPMSLFFGIDQNVEACVEAAYG